MGKLTISMAIFNSFLYVYQRVAIFESMAISIPPWPLVPASGHDTATLPPLCATNFFSAAPPSSVALEPRQASPSNSFFPERSGGNPRGDDQFWPSWVLLRDGIVHIYIYIWVNDHISLSWKVRPFGDDFPKINHDSRVWSWSNLPRSSVLSWCHSVVFAVQIPTTRCLAAYQKKGAIPGHIVSARYDMNLIALQFLG